MREFIYQKLIHFSVDNPKAQQVGLPQIAADQATVESILRIVFGVAAALAILVIILGSLTIVTGGGDPEKISRGKNTVIYALVGLAIAVSAEAIVSVVINKL